MSEQIRVMISSTVRDLPQHREKVMDACMRLGVFYPDMMEHLTAADANALHISLEIVDRADVYIGIIGFRYGYVPDGKVISVTEAEYNRAKEREIPRLIFLMSNKHSVTADDVETGEGAEKLKKLRERLQMERVVAFFDSPDDLKAKVIQALVPYSKPREVSGGPQPVIHTLSTQLDIEGREAECAAILQAMSEADPRVYAFAAPGGFGKTALLTKVVKTLSPDGHSIVGKVSLPDGTIETHTSALLHIDCRNDVKLSELFAKAGRLIGQEKQFEEIYNTDDSLSDKLQEIFGRLSTNAENRTWFMFDNFESMLNDKSEVVDLQLREFFSSVFSGGHNVRSLIIGRDVPRFSPREQVKELEAVGGDLFEGLPLDDCVRYLKKNGAAKDLKGSDEQVDAVLREFSERVHRIPLALVWATGYLVDTGNTVREILDRPKLFADFDAELNKAADRYENKGLKRLHYEQLKIQPAESLQVLGLLAFFKRAVPKGALAHLMDEVPLNKTLTRLERNKLVTRKESGDAYTRYLNDPLATNLYGLHPVICENEFFTSLPDRETLYETGALKCWERAGAATGVNRFAYALELYDCGERLNEHLVKELNREDLLNNYAAMLLNKGTALWSLTRLAEALVEYDKAIAIRERLVHEEQQTHLANDLAMAYMNKGNVLQNLTRLAEALVEYDKANAIWERLIHEEQQTHLANHLAMAYMNKGIALRNLTRFTEALAEYDKGIAILERLVHEEQQTHLANELAMAYMNKGVALRNLSRLGEALAEYNKAIAIQEQLVYGEQQTHLAHDLAMAYVNKGVALQNLSRLAEALAEYDKAIVIWEQLVHEQQQTHLANYLAVAYMNKGIALEGQSDFDEALACYEKSSQGWTFCVEHLNMFWVMPKLLETLRYRLMTLLQLERWPIAAGEFIRFRALFTNYIEREDLDEGLKEAVRNEIDEMISVLRELSSEQRELLYAEMGPDAEQVRSLIDNAEDC
jgi:tetratricopeptide (TPR) repeat protein